MAKRVLLILLFISIFNSILAQVPVWHWAKDANSIDPETLWEVATDPTSSDIYVGGSFKGNLSSKYGVTFASTTGNMDALVAKYDALGNVIWAFKISGPTGDEEVRGVAVDPSGNVYVTGNFNSTSDFDPSGVTFNLTTSGNNDGFLAKYSSAGNFLWAVKLGGSANEISYKMFADINGIYITGSYESNTTTFYSYSSPVTKTPFFNDNQTNMFGAKYNASGIVQWVISGGSNLDDYGLSVIADVNNVYFLGIYFHDISFISATGVTGATMPDEQHNEANTFILSVTQAGNLGWQTNITSSEGGKDVIGWNITQDASNLYVTGQSDGIIHFKYPTPTLTQAVSSGNDLFLAKLSKTGNFLWNASATGSGNGEQIGRALEIDGSGNIILTGNFTTGLNYSSVGGPNFTASGQDVFITSYNNAGTFLWSFKAGGTGTENVNGLAADNSGNIYLAGDHGGTATFGTVTLGADAGTNIFLAKLGCAIISNNTILAAQTICTGNAPSTLIGSLPVGGNLYSWQMSANTLTWTNASGTYTNQNYSPPTLTTTTYYKRVVNSISVCANISISQFVTITVNELPSIAIAGSNQTVCGPNTALFANTPLVGNGVWQIVSGTGNYSNINSPQSNITNLSAGVNKFVWIISNGVCPQSLDTVIINSDAIPSDPFAGADTLACADIAIITAASPLFGVGSWSLVSGNCTVTTISPYAIQINLPDTFANILTWTIKNGICPDKTDNIIVTRVIPPSAADAGLDQVTELSLQKLNAIMPAIGRGKWSVVEGNAEFENIHDPITTAKKLAVGNNILRWTTYNGTCRENTDDILVYVKPLMIPNGFSPNSDGFNDKFVITSLDYYEQVKFSVFNRWGALLYNNNNYKNDWAGTNSSNDKLVDDTYYYLLDIPGFRSFTGFIVLKQNR